MRDFAAIDFETANYHQSSVCSAGIVIVRNGKVTKEIYHLIRPNPNYYSAANVRVHGLTRKDTDPAPHFDVVWNEISPLLEGLPLIAHFSRFDEGCLRAALARYSMPWPGYQFHCSCAASRKKLGRLLPNHKLDTVAGYFGYDEFQHHHALADARACAGIWYSLTENEKLEFDI